MQSKYVLYPLLNLAIGKYRKSEIYWKKQKVLHRKMKMENMSFKLFL